MDKKYHSNEEMIERAEANLRLAEEMGYRTIISKVYTRIQELDNKGKRDQKVIDDMLGAIAERNVDIMKLRKALEEIVNVEVDHDDRDRMKRIATEALGGEKEKE